VGVNCDERGTGGKADLRCVWVGSWGKGRVLERGAATSPRRAAGCRGFDGARPGGPCVIGVRWLGFGLWENVTGEARAG
jgi:hypothetical protein